MPFRGVFDEMAPQPPATAAQIIGTILYDGLDHYLRLKYDHRAYDCRMLHRELSFFPGRAVQFTRTAWNWLVKMDRSCPSSENAFVSIKRFWRQE